MTSDLDFTPAEDEFLIARTFAAPRRLVFQAWTDPQKMAQWWGPHAIVNFLCKMDVRTGGAWRIDMLAPDGAVYPAKGIYREVVAPERLVFTTDCSEHPAEWHDLVNPNRGNGELNPAGEMVSLVTFDEHDGGTTLAIRTRFETPAIRDAMLAMGMTRGWAQSLERLDMLLAADREVVTDRVIDAPRDVVFRAFSEPRHLAQWWGPAGFTNTFHEFDLRPGGHWRFVMHGPDGADYENRSVFDEIVRPERIVFRHLHPPEHPFQMTILFIEQGDRTRLIWRMRHETAEKSAAVRAFVAPANEQNFDRLEVELAKMTTSAH